MALGMRFIASAGAAEGTGAGFNPNDPSTWPEKPPRAMAPKLGLSWGVSQAAEQVREAMRQLADNNSVRAYLRLEMALERLEKIEAEVRVEKVAPADLIHDVTPEMIEAGLPHLYRYHPDRGVEAEETVTRIYRAMRDLAPGKGS